MKVVVINGPNMNMLGKREPDLYGRKTLADIEEELSSLAGRLGITVSFVQSNIEGELVDALQKAGVDADGVILNGAAYTHTSVAMRDAVAAIGIPVVEVHLTNPQAREDFRRTSLLADVCAGSISGFGAESYVLALLYFERRKQEREKRK
jgi:3-dehydroquinate dehydratase-2